MTKILVKGALGKMGMRIIALAHADKAFHVVERIDAADVMIDFSHPDVTLSNLELVAKAKSEIEKKAKDEGYLKLYLENFGHWVG